MRTSSAILLLTYGKKNAFRDIAKVEAVSSHLRARLRQGRVWKALAERLTLRWDHFLPMAIQQCDAMVNLLILPLNL